jgi:hypothetical protein
MSTTVPYHAKTTPKIKQFTKCIKETFNFVNVWGFVHMEIWRVSKKYPIAFLKAYEKRGPLSLVSTTEELLDRKVAAPV